MDYLVDAWQRAILTWDVLRERGNQYLEHERQSKPPVLVFDYEMVLDARQFATPANYALVRIKPGADNPPTDANKRPFVVIDPRAGHGPGIGGFKIDSQIGIALKQGHPCYFVMFFPQPVPGQTIESVVRRRGRVRAQGERAAPAGGGPSVPDRQLPGRLGADDARRARAQRDGPDPAGRLAAVVLGGRRRAEPDALPGRAARWHLDGVAVRRSRQRQVRRRPHRQQLREPRPREHLLEQALQPLRQGRHGAASGSWSSRSGGAATS